MLESTAGLGLKLLLLLSLGCLPQGQICFDNSLTVYYHQKEKLSKYLTFDSREPSGPYIKSKIIIIRELKFLSR